MMIKSSFLLVVILGLMSCSGEKSGITTDLINNPSINQSAEMPVITYKQERVDFGTIKEGDKVTSVFEFTNTGTGPLIISGVTASCGCTVPNNWPKDPIQPGEQGKFEVTFNSTGKPGQQVKQITIEANTNPSISVVAIAGTVIRPTL